MNERCAGHTKSEGSWQERDVVKRKCNERGLVSDAKAYGLERGIQRGTGEATLRVESDSGKSCISMSIPRHLQLQSTPRQFLRLDSDSAARFTADEIRTPG